MEPLEARSTCLTASPSPTGLNGARKSVAGSIMQLTASGYILGKRLFYFADKNNLWVVIGAPTWEHQIAHISAVLTTHDSNPGTISQSPGG